MSTYAIGRPAAPRADADEADAPLGPLAPGIPLPVPEFLDLGIGLAKALDALHGRKLVHGAIEPSRVRWDHATGRCRLVGTGVAVEQARHAPPPAPAYVSPEQTGRINRSVDHRTDLYSLGITFYELLTGRRPFEAPDALGLVHCHLAAEPVPPSQLEPAIPEAVSRIVLKLMAKMAEDRYQSGHGLAADLSRCREQLVERDAIAPFELGREDVADQLQVPQRLFGRERELERLLAAFARVRTGGRELALVGGYAGVGKTALVKELQGPVAAARGCFLEGKFDQLQRDVPYFAWIQALGGLVRVLLTESDAALGEARSRILQAVGSIGGALTEVVPALELILGPQPSLPAMGGAEARNRLSYVFLAFLRAVATPERPLVVFLDDLQWIDAASLDLLETLLDGSDVSHLLLVGAYRDNEVGPLHPLTRALERLGGARAAIERLALEDLSEPTVDRLMAETLHAAREQTRPLTRLLYAKTGGNPFFLLQTLRALVEQRAVAFDPGERRWAWDLALLERLELTGNVVALMIGKVQELPAEAQRLLPLAACIGFRFDAVRLGVIAEQPEADVLAGLAPALRDGLVIPLEDGFQFAHDRIQQAAYALTPEAERKRVHLRIGRLLLQHASEREREERLFTAADHLNVGAELLEGRDERLALARLDLRAGQKARASAAFSAAGRYLEAGVALLDAGAWETAYDLALELHTGAAEAASLVGNYDRTAQLFAVVVARGREVTDTLGVYDATIHAFMSQGRPQEGLDAALEILGKLGLHVPAHPTMEDIGRALAETRALHAGRVIAELAALPPMTDPNRLAIVRIVTKAAASAYSGRPTLCMLFILEQVALYLRYGNTPESPYFYAGYSMVLCGVVRDFETARPFGELALALLEAPDSRAIRSKTMDVIGGYVWHFGHHLRATLPYAEDGYRSGLETGDLENAGYNGYFYCFNSFFAGVELQQLEPMMDAYGESLKRIRAETAWRALAPYWQTVKNLTRASGDDPCRLMGAVYDEDAMRPVLEATQHSGGLAAFYSSRLVLCVLFEDAARALESAELAERHKGGMFAKFSQSATVFYDSLARIMACAGRPPEERAKLLERVAANQQVLKQLADAAPMNHLHKLHLVDAERARLAGDGMTALDGYARAAALAREHGFLHEEALAHELAGRFWLERGHEAYARLHLRLARDGYRAWGAARKVRDMEERHARLLGPDADVGPGPLASGGLDLATLMKAAHAISREIEVGRLLGEVIRIVAESAGARRGRLLLERDGRWEVAAAIEIGTATPEAAPGAAGEEPAVAMGVVRLVARTRERVVLDDAASVGPFVADPYVRARRTKSLLCAPLLSQGRLAGIVHLENELSSGVFGPERLEVLELLLAQAAISLENARVYEALKKSEAKYRQIVDTANEGIWMLDAEARTTFVNARMADMLGYAVEEMLGRPMADFLFEEDRADHADRIRRRREGVAEHYERRHRCKDGTAAWAVVSTTPMFDEQHRFAGAFGMLTDITERRLAEEEVRRLNQELEARVAQRTVALAAANEELESFSYSVSHDLRAPLRAVSGFSDLLQRRHGAALDADGRHLLDQVSKGAERMNRLIEDLLAFARMARSTMRHQPVDMTALAREVIAELRAAAPERTLRVVLPELPAATGDRALLRQVWSNLLGNAVKYTSRRAEAVIELSGEVREGERIYAVRDNGAGFEMRYADKLFGVFQRLHGEGEFPGTGIGLAIVRRIVQRHGGRVWAEGEVDRGASFHFALPAAS